MLRFFAIYADEAARLVGGFLRNPSELEFALLVLILVDWFKAPLAIVGLAMWTTKWAKQDAWRSYAAFAAGAFAAFDWTAWRLDLRHVALAAVLGFGGMWLYRGLCAAMGGRAEAMKP